MLIYWRLIELQPDMTKNAIHYGIIKAKYSKLMDKHSILLL